MNQPTRFLWYDLETWGTNPRCDGIAQFAAIITDHELNPVDSSIEFKCQPLIDKVIDPAACLVTGLTPQECQTEGLNEWEFAKTIHQLMSQPGTCVAGYNNLRFDDEFNRYLFFRNLLDPYSREWQNGNSRWDLLDVMRMAYALRPEGIHWPVNEQGQPSFRLEELAKANGIDHVHAHDALSDVVATIGLARLLKQQQPKLFSYALSLNSKKKVQQLLALSSPTPMLQISGMIPASQGCLGVILPLVAHPQRPNEIIILDITEDPSWLFNQSPSQLRTWLYTPKDRLTADEKRPPFRTLHLNRCPMIAPLATLDANSAQRLGLDLATIRQHFPEVEQHQALVELAKQLFNQPKEWHLADPEQQLYQGFISQRDGKILQQLHQTEAIDHWPEIAESLNDGRLRALVFQARARHFPESLTEAEQQRWQQIMTKRLSEDDWGSSLTLNNAITNTKQALNEHPESNVLSSLLDWHHQQACRVNT